VELTVVNPLIDPSKTIKWTSPIVDSEYSYQPHHLCTSISEIPTRSIIYDVVFLSAKSLQDFQTCCADLGAYINNDTVIVIESTGYVNLEPFVKLCYPKLKGLTIVSIMNESDVKQISSDSFLHTVRNNDSRIYLGTTTAASSKEVTKSSNFQRLYKLLQTIQEESRGSISLLRSLNPNEFMTYQWKLALPRIVFDPLSIIFEAEFPLTLSSQILCKPLVTGTINELFKIIKKMECKLVKGYENETNLLQNQKTAYPQTTPNPSYCNSSPLLYKFHQKYDLEIDLLLLQPILLGDDHGVRTPYLENLYSTICQINRINSGESLFFQRKGESTGGSSDRGRVDLLSQELELKMDQLNLLDQDINRKVIESRNIENSQKDQERRRIELENQITKKEMILDDINGKLQNADSQWDLIQMDHEQKLILLREKQQQAEAAANASIARARAASARAVSASRSTGSDSSPARSANGSNPEAVAQQEHIQNSNSNRAHRESVQPNDNLDDLTDIALYGFALGSKGTPPPPQSNGKIPHVEESNVATTNVNINDRSTNGNGPEPKNYGNPQEQKHPGAMLGNGFSQNVAPLVIPQHQHDENYGQQQHQPQQGPPPQQYQQYQQYQQQPYQQQQFQQKQGFAQNGGPGYSPMDQQPPHGLPANGLPANQLPANLRGSASMVSSMNKYQQQQQQQQYQSYQYQQQYQQPQMMNGPPRQHRVNSNPSLYGNAVYNEGNGGYGPQQNMQPGYNNSGFNNTASFQNAAPIDPMVGQRFKPKKQNQNRRSAFPQMNGNLDGLDMGGRGGMPMPGSGNHTKHRSMGPLTSPLIQQKKSFGSTSPQFNLPSEKATQDSRNHLQPPTMNESNGSSNSSTNTNETPITQDGESDNGDVTIDVPQAASSQPKAYGTMFTPPAEDKKKKRGFFGKKKS